MSSHARHCRLSARATSFARRFARCAPNVRNAQRCAQGGTLRLYGGRYERDGARSRETVWLSRKRRCCKTIGSSTRTGTENSPEVRSTVSMYSVVVGRRSSRSLRKGGMPAKKMSRARSPRHFQSIRKQMIALNKRHVIGSVVTTGECYDWTTQTFN